MKLKTIWTLPSMQLMERLRRTRELGFMTLAAKLPQRLRYAVAINEISRATFGMPGDTVIPEIRLSDLLENLDAPKNLA